MMFTQSAYAEALDYIFSRTNFERKQMPKYAMTTLDLSRTRRLLAALDNPLHHFPVLLIAGTKGKGSTAAISHSILCAAGYKAGLYSSPHLHTFRERIRVGHQLISPERVIALAEEIRPHADKIEGLTAWEVMTALAFLTFAQEQVEVAVLEVGLGGRLDATNVTEPAVSVITSISYDHVHLLGNTLTLIAREKAGIIRPGGTVISAPQYPEAMSAIEAVCREQNARLTVVGDEVAWRVGRASLAGQTFYLAGESYSLPLLGRHQTTNAVTAITAVQALAEKLGLTITSEAMQTGVAGVNWPGRLEILSREPLVLVDSAMNGDSAEKLRDTLADYFPGRSLLLVFGASNDHDYAVMLQALLPSARRAIMTQANHPRATPPETLAQTAQALGYRVSLAQTVAEALALALESGEDRDLVCVAGSLFCVADARLAWAERAGLPLPETDPQ